MSLTALWLICRLSPFQTSYCQQFVTRFIVMHVCLEWTWLNNFTLCCAELWNSEIDCLTFMDIVTITSLKAIFWQSIDFKGVSAFKWSFTIPKFQSAATCCFNSELVGWRTHLQNFCTWTYLLKVEVQDFVYWTALLFCLWHVMLCCRWKYILYFIIRTGFSR
jgi:hypothetical protein